MNVTKDLKINGIDKLKENFNVSVKEYEDRYVLNYNQFDSPRFHPIVDECRGLILDKQFNVLCRPFNRFYNAGEGTNCKNGFSIVKTHKNPKLRKIREMDFKKAIFRHKMDGSLIKCYYDGTKWQMATRGTAFAEAETMLGITYIDLIKQCGEYPRIINFLNNKSHYNQYTFLFELTSPANKIVTPYSSTKLTLLAIVNNNNGLEINSDDLDLISETIGIKAAQRYQVDSYSDLLHLVEHEFPALQEGVVVSWEEEIKTSKFKQLIKQLMKQIGLNKFGVEDMYELKKIHRLKLKNTRYCAVHNMRANGNISPKNVLFLVAKNEHHEYLTYFEEDKPMFDLVENSIKELKEVNEKLYEQIKNIEDQKEFALEVNKNKECHPPILFEMRKGRTFEDFVKTQLEKPKAFVSLLNLKEKFKQQFGIDFDKDEGKDEK